MGILKRHFLTKYCLKILSDLSFKRDYSNKEVFFIDGNNIKNTFSFNNKKCHLNSFDNYKKNKELNVVLCFTNPKDTASGFIHFINYDKVNDVYIDDTLGSDSHKYKYYIINTNWIKDKCEKDNPRPNNWLTWAKKDFYDKYCDNWLWRIFVNEDDI